MRQGRSVVTRYEAHGTEAVQESVTQKLVRKRQQNLEW